MMIRKFFIMLAFIGYSAILISSCGGGEGEADKGRWESINSGTISCYVEDGLYGILEKPIDWYREQYKDVDLTVNVADARESMKQLFSGTQRIVITSRPYLKDEDSLMKVYGVKPHTQFELAKDGLVFFVKADFPLDTINDAQLQAILGVNDASFGKFFPTEIKSEPEIFINSFKSSEYANLVQLVCKGNKPRIRLNFLNSPDSVISSVLNSDNGLGIAYLGQVYPRITDGSLKALRVGWQDSSGKYMSPVPVHQSYFVMEKYPYILSYRAYLLSEVKDLPYWFATYLGKETKVQKYFLESGIVPAFAKFRLIKED